MAQGHIYNINIVVVVKLTSAVLGRLPPASAGLVGLLPAQGKSIGNITSMDLDGSGMDLGWIWDPDGDPVLGS